MNGSNNLNAISTRADLNSSASDFFNNYFQPNFTVSNNVDNAILAHFEQMTNNKQSAKILASSVIYTSLAQKIDPMVILDKIRAMDSQEAMTYVSLFLNMNRISTSYLGTRFTPRRSKYVNHMIRP